jgi:hypothetical protein
MLLVSRKEKVRIKLTTEKIDNFGFFIHGVSFWKIRAIKIEPFCRRLA